MTVTIDGLAGVTTPALIYPGASTGALTITAPFTSGTFAINFPAANGTVLLVDTTGSIALTSPLGGTLTISPPNIATDTSFVFPTSIGTNGYVLTTDGAGNTYWSTNSSPVTIGATAVNGGAVGASLLTKISGTLQEIVMGTGVATALGNATNAVGGLVTYNGTLGTTTQIAGSTSGNLTLQAQATASGTLTFPNGNGAILAAAATLTQGSVLFAGAGGIISEDNPNLFWDNTNNQLIIGSNTTVSSPANIQLAVTKDAYINGLTVGLGAGQVATNTTVGKGALAANTAGANNTAVGSQTLGSNSSGNNNTAVGRSTLFNNTSGGTNAALGASAMLYNTIGSANTASGYAALSANSANVLASAIPATSGLVYTITSIGTTDFTLIGAASNTVGLTFTTNGTAGVGSGTAALNVAADNNAAFGYQALFANTASNNSAFGAAALQNNTTATNQTAVGYQALFSSTTGNANSALGYRALYANTTGTQNTALGSGALSANLTVSNNTAVGFNALLSNTTGTPNTAVGSGALSFNLTGADNVALGYRTLFVNTASNNTAIGSGALVANTSGADNVAVGKGALAAVTIGNNNLAIGVNSGNDALGTITTASNQIIVGNASHTNAYIQASWTVVSDIRDKNVLGGVSHGLAFVEKLQPIRYRFKEHRDSDVSHGPVRYGFSAQDILALEGSDNVVVDTTDADKLKITESNLIPILVNAIRQLSNKVARLESLLADQRSE